MPPKFVVQTNCHIIVKIAGKLPNQFYSLVTTKIDQKVQGYVTNITETVEEGKPSIITSVLVETAVFADCHFFKRRWKTANASRILPLKTFMQMVPTKDRGLLKHRMHAYSRCMWMNLRRMVIFQISTFQRSIFALFGPIRETFGSFMANSRKMFTSGADCYVSL